MPPTARNAESSQIAWPEDGFRRIPSEMYTDASVLARHINRGDNANVHGVGDPTAPDRHRILDHITSMLT